jgi:phage gpG-like protein
MISVRGLKSLADALAQLDLAATQREALERAVTQVEAAVKDSLSHVPGDDHSTPWIRTGGLRDSISHTVDESGALIGSNDPIAVYQELGTRTIPPRSFLASSAAGESDEVADSIGAAVVDSLRGAIR